MGQFSWIYSDTDKQLLDDVYADTYLLVPKPFQEKYGKAIYEKCYDGYGHFGDYDVYDLVLEWNREMIPEIIRRIKNGTWHTPRYNTEDAIKNLQAYYGGEKIECKPRKLGIYMANHDKDNAILEFPIKITTKELEYENVEPSLNDPNQGWSEDEDDCEDDY